MNRCMLIVFFNKIFFFFLLLNRDEITVTVKFTSRFLYPAEASLILLSKSAKSTGGTTLTFTLKGKVRNFKAIVSKFYRFCMSSLLFSGHGVFQEQLFFQVLSPGSSCSWRSCVYLTFAPFLPSMNDILTMILIL